MKVPTYNLAGKAVGEIELPEAVFKRSWNADLVHQVVAAQIASRRQTVAHSKGRGEVSGGGKKPWRQKGTGRARHGSIRSPIWKGGGVSHGPVKTKVFAREANRKMVRAAIHASLSKRLMDGDLRIIEAFDFKEPKTKLLASALKAFGTRDALIVSGGVKPIIGRIARNIPKVKSVPAANLTAEDILSHRVVLMDKEAATSVK